MIALDASVAVKWFRPGERFDVEARALLQLISGFQVPAIASEWISLEVVRGLERAQQKMPQGAAEDQDLHAAYAALQTLFRSGALVEVRVSEVKVSAKNAEITLHLCAADAVHLATAVQRGAGWLVTDDRHLLSEPVREYAAGSGVRVVNPGELMTQLGREGSRE